MDGNAPTLIPKDYYLGFNFSIDRQSATNLIAFAQQAVSVRGKSVTVCFTSIGVARNR
jgi:hypothetical protein